MASKQSVWQTISLAPLSGILDTRSRPADVPVGGYRWKQNWAITSDGKLSRRQGFARFWNDAPNYVNQDFHHQIQTREPITFQFESTTNDGVRRFYIGTQTGLWRLHDEAGVHEGEYEKIYTSTAPEGTRWHAAEVQNSINFTNDHDPVMSYDPASPYGTPAVAIPSLVGVAHAAVIVQWNGILMVMNTFETDGGGTRHSSRIRWSDLNTNDFTPDPMLAGSLANFQDLNYGDDILAAAPLLGSLYIFTRRGIWKMSVSGDPTSIFAFSEVYTEPKNQAGCIAFPNTLVSTGQDLYYMGRDGIYRYNPYIPVPEREDWLHRADGLMYRTSPSQLDTNFCQSPVAEYMPTNREIWFSWPSKDQVALGQGGINNWTLVAQIEQKTADVVDHGFTSLVNFRRTATSTEACNEAQDLLGASGTDWTIKSIGGPFYRELYNVMVGDYAMPEVDLAPGALPVRVGYNSILRGMVPLGLTDREKRLRSVLVDLDATQEVTPCALQLRIGSAFSMVDPNDASVLPVVTASAKYAPLWRIIKDARTGLGYKLLQSPDQMTIAEMVAKNLSSNLGMQWQMYENGRFLYYELTIMNQDGTEAIGGDVFLQRLDFDVMVQPKS